MELNVVSVDELDLKDLEWLQTAREDQLGGISPGSLAERVAEGRAQLWKYTGDEGQSGIIITTVLDHEKGKELFVWLMAGRGLRPHMNEIMERLSEFAKATGCKWLTGRSKPAIARVLQRQAGFDVRRHEVVKEV